MYVTGIDLVLAPLYLAVIFFFANQVKRRNISANPIYKYYLPGLLAKMFGAISICLIYVFYYGGGDTLSYYQGISAMHNLFYKDSEAFFSILLGDIGNANFSVFDVNTGGPPYYMWKDPKTMFVIRFITPFSFLGLNRFMLTAIVLAWLTYGGIWRLYIMLNEQFPKLWREFAIAVLFIPSVVFWGSGILKDTITFAAVCWYTYSFYRVFISKEKRIVNVVALIMISYIIIAIKPYIFLALMPGSLIWASYNQLANIKSIFLKVAVGPVIILLFAGIGIWTMNSIGSAMGDYEIDKVLNKAVINQQDLIRSGQYGENYFDIGTFDASFSSVISKAPQAIIAALFRPFLWEARNPVMLMSALENTFMLILTIWLLFKVGPINFFRLIGKHPLLVFAISFSLVFAFGVGLSTGNFGALVRYKIPAMPFFLSILFILRYYYQTGLYRVKDL